jgi:hypothetical protein
VWSGTVTGSRPGSYKAVRVASANGAGSTSASKSLAMTFAASISAATTAARHGHAIRVSGHVRPSAWAAHRKARIEVYSHGRWVLAHYVTLDGSGNVSFYESRSTKGTRTIRLRLTGGSGYSAGNSNSITLHWN